VSNEIRAIPSSSLTMVRCLSLPMPRFYRA
jgi:hypothetical protein